LASCSTQGLDGLAANFHAALRQRMNWPGGAMRPRPVHLNTWEGFYFDLEPTKVMELADAAAAVGVERFVVDDGWFHGRHHDRAALGDWWPDAGKFPDGLGPLVAHVNRLGMEFGLWVEPEMVNPDSNLFRTRPDWALQLQGRPLITARNQLVLDIARPAASDYLFDKISALLAAHPIGYLKWDLNRDLTTAGLADGTAGYRAQVQAAYALMARLRAAHPAGGDRKLLGRRRSHRLRRAASTATVSGPATASTRCHGWTSSAASCSSSRPRSWAAHVGTAPAHTTGRTQSLGFAAAVALPGHFGHGTSTCASSAAPHVRAAGALDRRCTSSCVAACTAAGCGAVRPATAWSGRRMAMPMPHDLLLFVYRTAPTNHRYMPPLRLPMLDRGALPRAPSWWPRRCRPPLGQRAALLDAMQSSRRRGAGWRLAGPGWPAAAAHPAEHLPTSCVCESLMHECRHLRCFRTFPPPLQSADRPVGAGVAAPRQAPLARPAGKAGRQLR
jgi:alpha-galactosidase